MAIPSQNRGDWNLLGQRVLSHFLVIFIAIETNFRCKLHPIANRASNQNITA